MRSSLAEFVYSLIAESQALHDAVWADAEALKYAGAVFDQRRKPPTPQAAAEAERYVREQVEISLLEIGTSAEEARQRAAEYPYVPFDAEDYLRPRVYQHRGEQFENEPQITEEDVKRYAWRFGAEGFSGTSRTDELLHKLRQLGGNGFSKPHVLHRASIAEAAARGLGDTLAPPLREAYEAHEAYLSAAKAAEESGARQIADSVFLRHNAAINALLLYLPPDEQGELEQATAEADAKRTTDNETDNGKKNTTADVPENPQVLRLAKRINSKRKTPGYPTKLSIAVEFCEGDEAEAKRLLRQLQPSRFGHLLTDK